MSNMVRAGFNANVNVPAASPDRHKFVKARLVELAKNAAEVLLETGLLLKEYRDNGYFKEDGHESFDAAIDAMHDQGLFEYRSRNARNMISIVEMAQKHQIGGKDLDGIGISKLREIASLPVEDQKKLLPKAKDMSVAEVQQEAKKKRAKAKGHDVDPLEPITFMTTATQKTFINTCIAAARRKYGLPDTVTPSGVLIDAILADWYSGLDQETLDAAENAGVIDGETVATPEESEEPATTPVASWEEDDQPSAAELMAGDEDDEPAPVIAAGPTAEELKEIEVDEDDMPSIDDLLAGEDDDTYSLTR